MRTKDGGLSRGYRGAEEVLRTERGEAGGSPAHRPMGDSPRPAARASPPPCLLRPQPWLLQVPT